MSSSSIRDRENAEWGDCVLTDILAAIGAAPDSVSADSGDGLVAAALGEMEPPEPRAWRAKARPEQLEVADSTALYTLYQAGRGSGKTFTAAHTFAEWTLAERGYWAIVAPTFTDARQICVEGPSGLINALGDDLVSYDRSKFEIHVRGGSVIYLASDDAPARLRGKNLNGIWGDEPGSWRNIRETWDEGIEFATRIGTARRLLTGTPKRGHRIIRELNERAARRDPDVRLVRGNTMDNAANLSQTFLNSVLKRYAGTSLGRQEIDGELLNEVEGALVTGALVEQTRLMDADLVPELTRIVVGVDPATTNEEGSDHTGIVVVGLGPAPRGWQPPNGLGILRGSKHAYLLEDASVKTTPEGWARRALTVADEWGADAIVAETNQGGDLVTTTVRLVATAGGLRTPAIRKVTASRAKVARAEPIAGLWQQHRMHPVGTFPLLEDEWLGWVPGESTKSPDRLDAHVWGVVGVMPELAMKGPTPVRVIA